MSSHPPPTFDSGSSVDLGPESSNNHVRTTENSPTIDDQLGMVIYPLNALFDIVEISPQRPYSLYDQSGVPLELSPSTCLAIRRRLFFSMEPEGNAPVTSPDDSKVSTPQTIEGEELQL